MQVQISQLVKIINAFEEENKVALNDTHEFKLNVNYEGSLSYWFVTLDVGSLTFYLSSKRQGTREFKSLDTVHKMLKAHSVFGFTVNG